MFKEEVICCSLQMVVIGDYTEHLLPSDGLGFLWLAKLVDPPDHVS